MVAEAMVVPLDKPLECAVGFFFGNVELSMELWTVIAGISGDATVIKSIWNNPVKNVNAIFGPTIPRHPIDQSKPINGRCFGPYRRPPTIVLQN